MWCKCSIKVQLGSKSLPMERHSHLMTWVNVGDRHATPSPKSPATYVLMKECNCILAWPFSMCIRYWIGVGRWGLVGGSLEGRAERGQGTGDRMDRSGLSLSRGEVSVFFKWTIGCMMTNMIHCDCLTKCKHKCVYMCSKFPKWKVGQKAFCHRLLVAASGG